MGFEIGGDLRISRAEIHASSAEVAVCANDMASIQKLAINSPCFGALADDQCGKQLAEAHDLVEQPLRGFADQGYAVKDILKLVEGELELEQRSALIRCWHKVPQYLQVPRLQSADLVSITTVPLGRQLA